MLFDHGTPAPLRNCLPGHDVDLAKERELDTWANGRLLKAAEAEGYDVFVTTDKSIPFQQNLAGISFAIIIVPANWPQVQRRLSLIQRAVEQKISSTGGAGKRMTGPARLPIRT